MQREGAYPDYRSALEQLETLPKPPSSIDNNAWMDSGMTYTNANSSGNSSTSSPYVPRPETNYNGIQSPMVNHSSNTNSPMLGGHQNHSVEEPRQQQQQQSPFSGYPSMDDSNRNSSPVIATTSSSVANNNGTLTSQQPSFSSPVVPSSPAITNNANNDDKIKNILSFFPNEELSSSPSNQQQSTVNHNVPPQSIPQQQQQQQQQTIPTSPIPQQQQQVVRPASVSSPAPQQSSTDHGYFNQQTLQVQLQQQHQIQLQQQQIQQLHQQTTQFQQTLNQQNAQTSQMVQQMQTYFEKLSRFMETVDRRLTNLETVTSDILKNQASDGGNIEKHFDRRELDSLKRVQEQYERDTEFARQLQAQFEQEVSKNGSGSTPKPVSMIGNTPKPPTTVTTTSTSSSTSSSSRRPGETEPMEDCPICGMRVIKVLLEEHVSDCLEFNESSSKDPMKKPLNNNGGQPQGPERTTSFWGRMFGKKEEGQPGNGSTNTDPSKSSTAVHELGAQPPANSMPSHVYYPTTAPSQTGANATRPGQPQGMAVPPGYPPMQYASAYPSFYPGAYPAPTGGAPAAPQPYYYYAVPPSASGTKK